MSNPFDMFGGLGGMGAMLSNFQQNMQQMQEEAKKAEFTVEVGGVVKVTATGAMQIASISIDPAAAEDPEMLEDLLMVAINQALEKAQNHTQEQMSALTAGLPIPPGMLGF